MACCNYTGFPKGNDCFGTSDPNSRCTNYPCNFKAVQMYPRIQCSPVNVDFFICFFNDQLKLYYQRASHQKWQTVCFSQKTQVLDHAVLQQGKMPLVLFHPDGESNISGSMGTNAAFIQAPSSRLRESVSHSFSLCRRHLEHTVPFP